MSDIPTLRCLQPPCRPRPKPSVGRKTGLWVSNGVSKERAIRSRSPRRTHGRASPRAHTPGVLRPRWTNVDILLLVKAEVFHADDEGSIPFTRSIFKIKHLYRNIEEAECA